MTTKQSEGILNPELYKRLLEPFPSKESAQDSFDKFFTEFRELREKYGIPDVVVIARAIYMEEEKKRDVVLTMNSGNSALVFPMIATAYDLERKKLLDALGMISIPVDMMDSEEFFSDFLLHIGVVKTQDEAEKLIKSGEIKVNGKMMLIDGPAPEEEFTITFRGESLKIPGRKSR